MAKVFRIIDRFKITGRGTVYTIKNNPDMNLHLEDILFDLQGHRFKIKGFEMIRRLILDTPLEEMPVGIMFEALDEVDAEGQILVDSLNDVNFLFCNHPLYQRRVDEDYQDEYQAAGVNHLCALFSYEDMERGILSLYGDPISGLTIYRGWMMKPEMYEKFYNLLEEKGIILMNTPEEYKRYHLLPGWYQDLKKETIPSIWENEGALDSAINLIRNAQGSYVIKDFVKSRKHEWYDACYIPDIENKEHVKKVVSNFIDRQGSSLVGGIVFREFVSLKSIGFHERSGMPISEEYRIFVFAGKVLYTDDYWERSSTSGLSIEETEWIKSVAGRIRSNFVTIDVARKEDGTLIIMEFGDGQVSGLQQVDASDFYRVFDER